MSSRVVQVSTAIVTAAVIVGWCDVWAILPDEKQNHSTPQSTNKTPPSAKTRSSVSTPPKELDALSIEASELLRIEAHEDQRIVAITLRNKSSHAVAYPALMLTLVDSNKKPVGVRGIAPGHYRADVLDAADRRSTLADVAEGIPANGRVRITVVLRAVTEAPTGYELKLVDDWSASPANRAAPSPPT